MPGRVDFCEFCSKFIDYIFDEETGQPRDHVFYHLCLIEDTDLHPEVPGCPYPSRFCHVRHELDELAEYLGLDEGATFALMNCLTLPEELE